MTDEDAPEPYKLPALPAELAEDCKQVFNSLLQEKQTTLSLEQV